MPRKILTLAVLSALYAGFLPLAQAEGGASALATLEPAVLVKTSASSAPAYELCDFFGSGDHLEISLKQAGTKSSRRYPLGKTTDGVLVEKADASTGVAVIVVAGARRTLSLAGEIRAGTVGKKTSKFKQDEAELRGNFDGWTFRQKDAATSALRASVDELFRSHPEYFEDPDSKTPEANAAIRAVLFKYFEAGNALSNAKGGFTQIENPAEKIATVFGTLEIRSATDNQLKQYAVRHGMVAKSGFIVYHGDQLRGMSIGWSNPVDGIAHALDIAIIQVPPDAEPAPKPKK